MGTTEDADSPWRGFWQVEYDDVDYIVAYPRFETTLSLGRSGFSMYTRSHFIEIRIAPSGQPPVGWPPTETEERTWVQATYVGYGACSWTKSDDGWIVEHRTVAGVGVAPRTESQCRARILGGQATVCDERWRRLSGPAESPLGGVWESVGPDQRWIYLTSAGHYAVVRESMNVEEGAGGRVGGNAGARVERAHSFDHWPFIGGGFGFSARKHETFRVTNTEADTFAAGFEPNGSDAVSWHRIE